MAQKTSTRRSLEKLGASSWLRALPLEFQCFHLTKGEFQDALHWSSDIMKQLSIFYPNGLVVLYLQLRMRWTAIVVGLSIISEIWSANLKSVDNDVAAEPMLQPVINWEGYKGTANLDKKSRIDIRPRSQNAPLRVTKTQILLPQVH